MLEAWEEVERMLFVKALQSQNLSEQVDALNCIRLIASVQEMLRTVVADGQLAAKPKRA